MRRLLNFGHGYVARALSKRLLAEGWQVTGTTRSPEAAAAMKTQGVVPVIWPGADMSAHLAWASHVLISAGPDAEGDPVLADLRSEIGAAAAGMDWLGYLSTTGVYGDRQGGWVDEATPCEPTTRRGQWRVAAESEWQALASESSLALHIFRLAGIYGPGRGPFAKLRAGTARRIVKPGQVFGRIHVEDIVEVLAASMARPQPGIFNVCDDEAAPPEDVIAHAAGLLGLPVPRAEAIDEADLSPMARSFYAESKRVRNDRIKRDLGVRLRYPDYRAGLAALLPDG